MLAQLLAARTGQRLVEIVLSAEIGFQPRPDRAIKDAGNAAAAAQHAGQRRHGRTVNGHCVERNNLRQMRVGGDPLQHRVERLIAAVTIENRRRGIAMLEWRDRQHPDRNGGWAGKTDSERPDPDQLRLLVAMPPCQQRRASGFGIRLGRRAHERRIHEHVRFIRAREQVDPRLPDFGKSLAVREFDGNVRRSVTRDAPVAQLRRTRDMRGSSGSIEWAACREHVGYLDVDQQHRLRSAWSNSPCSSVICLTIRAALRKTRELRLSK
jgi:hypothetical protein